MGKGQNDKTERARADLAALLLFAAVLAVYFLYQASFLDGIKRLL